MIPTKGYRSFVSGSLQRHTQTSGCMLLTYHKWSIALHEVTDGCFSAFGGCHARSIAQDCLEGLMTRLVQ